MLFGHLFFGKNPYLCRLEYNLHKHMYRTHTCGELRIENKGQRVTLAGWVQKARKLGGMTFIDLRDRYGITQLVVEADAPASLVEIATSLGREFVIQATGEVVERQAKNAKMPTDRKSTRLNSSHIATSRMPSSAWSWFPFLI